MKINAAQVRDVKADGLDRYSD